MRLSTPCRFTGLTLTALLVGCATLAGIEEGSPLPVDSGVPESSASQDATAWPDSGDAGDATSTQDATDAMSCPSGFGDCDGNAQNGCETALGTYNHCADCNDRCKPPSGVGVCSKGTCKVSSCPSGQGDCDGVFQNGCEAPLNTKTNCGACSNTCAGSLVCNANPGPQCACRQNSHCSAGSTGACGFGVCQCSGTNCMKGQVCVAGGKCGTP
jgi:hypothetical protein